MESAVAEREAVPGSDTLVPLEAILCTDELNRRPPRAPDYQTENRALSALVRALADSPRTILQTLSDTILKSLNAGSAGVSLLTRDDGAKRFYWAAIAGAWKPHIGEGTPRDFGPCGDVLDHDTPLLFCHFERRYTYFLPVTPLAEECLLVPFYLEGKAVGTIWAIAHDKRRRFDSEDLRQLESLGRFASAAYHTVQFLDAFQHQDDALRQNQADLGRRVAELQKANTEARESRRAALNLMQDSVQSRQTVERLNEQLSESEYRYRTLFELGPVAIYSIDTSGVIQNFNRRAAELWGRQPALGDTEERFCGSFKLFRPDGSSMPHEDCPMAEVVTGKIPAAHDAEVIIERPDTSRVTVVVNIRPLKNERGEITGAINCFYDITERKQAEAQLADELDATKQLHKVSTELIREDNVEETYERILDAAVAIMRSEFASIQMLYPERGKAGELRLLAFRGFNPEAARFWEWVQADSESTCGVALRSGQRVIVADIEKCDFMAGTADQAAYLQTGIHAVQSTPLISRNGKLLGMISTHWRRPHQPSERDLRRLDLLARQAADLIERSQAEQALRRAHELVTNEAAHLETLVQERTARLQETIGELEHFSYTITHDMRAPLRAMQGFGSMLLEDSGGSLSPRSADYLRRIMDGSRRMDNLICDSLQYAKVVRERIALTSAQPGPILRGILDSYPALQPPKVKIQLVEPLPPVMANEAGLAQCFSNLLANAIKFVKPGVKPKIRVWAEVCGASERKGIENSATLQHSDAPHSDPSTVRFWFEDNGIGIPLQYHDRIFGMFQQLDKSYEGTGIGLALVRKTAERMHGKVGVESEPGKGSRFWLEFKSAK